VSVLTRLNAPPPRTDGEVLPSVPTREELALLAAAGVARAVLPGEQLFRRGDEAQSMYLIDDGQVRLSFEDGLADKILGAGQYFGEL
jgi:CRP-like cAMP-binding protein